MIQMDMRRFVRNKWRRRRNNYCGEISRIGVLINYDPLRSQWWSG